MKIGIVGSMHYAEKMLEAKNNLEIFGHEVFLTGFANSFVGKNDEEKENLKIFQKMHEDAIREFWYLMQGADAILVLNLDKGGVPNYIGGNTFLEMGFAHVLQQRIFLYNPIPENPLFKSEIEAMDPVVIFGDLGQVV